MAVVTHLHCDLMKEKIDILTRLMEQKANILVVGDSHYTNIKVLRALWACTSSKNSSFIISRAVEFPFMPNSNTKQFIFNGYQNIEEQQSRFNQAVCDLEKYNPDYVFIGKLDYFITRKSLQELIRHTGFDGYSTSLLANGLENAHEKLDKLLSRRGLSKQERRGVLEFFNYIIVTKEKHGICEILRFY